MTFTPSMTILTYLLFFTIVGMVIFISIKKSTPPKKKYVDIYHPYKFINDDTYFFYYQRATAYRMLFGIHTSINNFFKILGTVSTFITLYCAVDNNDFILLFSLIAATSEGLILTIPVYKYSEIYVNAARILEYALNEDYINQDDTYIHAALEKAYKQAEEIIQSGFM